LEQQRDILTACIHDARAHIEIVTQDLDISRSFAPEEGTMDEETVLSEFRQLGRLTNATVTHIIQMYSPEIRNGKLTQRSPDLRDVGPFVDLILQHHPDTKLEHIMTYAIHYKLRARMMNAVFHQLVPGIPKDDNDLLNDLYQNIKMKESQERSARWRAMTYWHLKPELRRYGAIVTRTLEDIAQLLNQLVEHQITAEDLIDHAGQQTKALFHSAATLQTKIQTSCTSTNIEVFLPTGPAFDRECMVAFYEAKGTTPTRYVIPIGLGMLKTWSLVDPHGTLRIHASYLTKASVICDNWQP